MKHRVAQVLLFIAGIGFVLAPFLTQPQRGYLASPRPTVALFAQILLGIVCFLASFRAGRNARAHRS